MNNLLSFLLDKKLPLVTQGDGSGVVLRERGGAFALAAERSVDGVRKHVSVTLSDEQAQKLKRFIDPPVARSKSDLSIIEIERKWRPCEADHLKELARWGNKPASVVVIEQGYLCIGEDEARIRRKDDSYFLTLKSGGGLARREVEIGVTKEQWRDLWPLTAGQRVEKVRIVMDVAQPNGVMARVEVDRFQGHLAPLVLVECEFSSRESAGGFVAPAYFGEEVTEDPRFKNKALARANPTDAQLSVGRLPKVT